MYTYVYFHGYGYVFIDTPTAYGVASISTLLRIVGIFCRKIPMKGTIVFKRDL